MTGHALVTGAAGFIGSHLSERLLTDGWLVTGVDNFAPTYETGLRRTTVDSLQRRRAFRFMEGDLLRIDTGDLLHDVDVVFHLAARPGVRSSWEDFRWALDANVMATKKLLYAMVRAETSARLVFASSSSVYGAAESYPTTELDVLRPISPYGVTKASAEQLIMAYVMQYGLDAVSLRYFTVFGPRQRPDMAFDRWIGAALTDRQLSVYGDGSAVRDFTYVSDVVEATVDSLVIPEGTFNVAGGNPSSIDEVIEIIAQVTDEQVEVRHLPKSIGDPLRTGGEVAKLQGTSGWTPKGRAP